MTMTILSTNTLISYVFVLLSLPRNWGGQVATNYVCVNSGSESRGGGPICHNKCPPLCGACAQLDCLTACLPAHNLLNLLIATSAEEEKEGERDEDQCR